MAQWVLDALEASERVRRIVVVGLPPADQPRLRGAKVSAYVPNQGSLLGNVEAGVKRVLELEPDAAKAMLVSSDIPCITPAMVDWMLDTCLATDHEVYYGLISHADMERRFPGSKRSYFTLKEGRFCGSDMLIVSTALVGHYHPGWHDIVGARKNILKQASLVGFDTLLLTVLRQMSIPEAERRAQSQLRIRGRILRSPYPETGMDVDKPNQYELVKRDLEARAGAA
jgi:hypothetical protein